MKQTLKAKISLALIFILALALCSCELWQGNADPWESAIYKTDTEFGEGAKTIQVEVKVLENKVNFTIHTDAQYLGEAMQEHGLLEGEPGAYGIYVKKVNGILADFDRDGHYWGFYQNGEYLMTGIDLTPISGGEHFEIIYSK